MNVREIVEDWLKEHGYDGLYNNELECGCVVPLLECEEMHEECQAGYKLLCDCERAACFTCEKACDGDDDECKEPCPHDFHVGPRREA